MKRKLKRCTKVLFFASIYVFITTVVLSQLFHVIEIVHSKFTNHGNEPGVKHYFDRGNTFTLWNFTNNVEELSRRLQYSESRGQWLYPSQRSGYESLVNTSLGEYMKHRKVFCDGMFQGFANRFAVLRNVMIDPTKAQGRRGGENITSVLNQQEESEYYVLSKGYFSLDCPANGSTEPVYPFSAVDHLQHWMSAVQFQQTVQFQETVQLQQRRQKLLRSDRVTRDPKVTICVQRYEYVNLYHTMTDFYNVYVMLLLFDLNPDDVNILWIDGHPKGGLDETWNTLFKHVLRAGDIKEPVIFKFMVWNIMGYYSLTNNHNLHRVPLLEEFRYFFLARHHVETSRDLNCSALTISFIWRRDYVAHPRNVDGHVQRKIENEEELVLSLKSEFPSHKISGSQLDALPMRMQLQNVAGSDILVGMHGAGLTHALFLPQHAALVELFPSKGTAAHFKSIARWRGLKYARMNPGARATRNDFTYISPAIIKTIISELLKIMC